MSNRWVTDMRIAKDGEGQEPKPKARSMGSTKRRQGFGGCTPARDEAMAFIAARLKEGASPSLEEIRVHMGWKTIGSARDCLRRIGGGLPPGFDRSVLLPTAGRKPYLARRLAIT